MAIQAMIHSRCLHYIKLGKRAVANQKHQNLCHVNKSTRIHPKGVRGLYTQYVVNYESIH